MRSLFLIYQVITLFLGAGTVSKLHKCGPNVRISLLKLDSAEFSQVYLKPGQFWNHISCATFFFKVNTTFFARNFNSNFLPSSP